MIYTNYSVKNTLCQEAKKVPFSVAHIEQCAAQTARYLFTAENAESAEMTERENLDQITEVSSQKEGATSREVPAG